MNSKPKVLTEVEKARALAELNAHWDKRLSVLNDDPVRSRAAIDALMSEQIRLNGRVRAGEHELHMLLIDAFESLAEGDRWFESSHPELDGMTPKAAADATVDGNLRVRALLAEMIQGRRGRGLS